MAFHLAKEIEANMQAGMSPEEAKHTAIRLTGSLALYQEECRDVRGTAVIENVARDFRYAIRLLRRNPMFTAVSLLTLALGIGANCAVFTAINTILFRSLPVKEPEQLVFFNEDHNVNMSYPNYRDFRDRNDVLSGLIAYRFNPISLSIRGGKNLRAWAYEATGNYFDVLGAQPLLGHYFYSEDDRTPGAHPVAVLSYRCWHQQFGGDRGIVNRTVKINSLDYTIVGVAPASFLGTELIISPDLWVPMSMEAQIEVHPSWLEDRSETDIWVLGRLKPGVSRQQAEASLNRTAAQLRREYPSINQGLKIQLSAPGLIGNAFRGPFIGFSSVLMTVAGFVLLLACMNLAGMLLARASDRRKEMAVRLSLGARRAQIVRQLLIESFLLAVAGGAAGFLLSFWISKLFGSWHPPFDVPVNTSILPDNRVLFFTLVAALLTTLLFGLAPAIQATRTDLVPALKNETVSERFRRWSLRDLVVVAQVAVSVVLVISSVLVVRSLQHALNLKLGFTPQHAISVSFDLGLHGYSEARGRAFQRQVLERVAALPGVQNAGTSSYMPLRVGMTMNSVFLPGKPKKNSPENLWATIYDTSPGFLMAAGTHLIRGRNIDAHDGPSSPQVALVNETFARKLLPNQNPLGKRFRFGQDEKTAPIEIIGVVEDGKYESLGEEPTAAVFEPVAQHYNGWTTLIVRTSLRPEQAIGSVRQVLIGMDPELPLFSVGTLSDMLAWPLFPARIAAIVLGAFGLLAMMLATTGIFALMAYAVSRRTREIGIRMALGARREQVLGFVLRRSAILFLIGIISGTALTFAFSRLLSTILYGISPHDPITYLYALLLMGSVALIASWYPARRAISIDPARTLREE
ncbi:MAG: ABC transporter permease [Acidobacteriota bacterium]|nr:ABC transporter permease [Acidobacteriota bacterium]